MSAVKKKVFACVRKEYPNVKDQKLEELWARYLENNTKIIDILSQQMQIEIAKNDKWRASAYRKAISSIKSYKTPIVSGKQASRLKGVGKKISQKITEILATGKLASLEAQPTKLEEKSRVLAEFRTIWGVGPVKAESLYDLGYRKLTDIPTGELNDSQRLGLFYRDDLMKKIPRQEITLFGDKFKEIILSNEEVYPIRMVIAGSYRRGLRYSGDIDILLSTESPDDPLPNVDVIIKKLKAHRLISGILSLGKRVFMGITMPEGTARRLDIHIVPYKEWGSQLLYFTGSAQFNIDTHILAKTKGYILGEHGLFDRKTHKRVEGIETEKEILKAIGMDYVEPKNRE